MRNPEAVKAARQRPEYKAASRRHARRRLGVTDTVILDWCAALDELPCAYCGVTPANGVDHVEPRVRGGEDTHSNLLPACSNCNGRKADRPLLEWNAARFAGATVG